jgi:hypothetical protein
MWRVCLALLSLVGLIALACGEGQREAPAVTPAEQTVGPSAETPLPGGTPTEAPARLPALANAPAFQEIPTYDGSGQATHPDIAYFADGWHGYKYWMAMTPYTYDSAGRENPSIVVSNDGSSWLVPPGLMNPLVPPPPCDHNSDPDLIYDPRTDELHLYYVESQRAQYCGAVNENHLRLMKSSDGVHWGGPQTVMTWDLGKDPLYVSPAVAYRRGSFEMWMASDTGGVVHATSEDGVNWSALQRVGIGNTPWHLDVAYVEGPSQYWMLFVDSPVASSRLRLATSEDGLTWDVYPAPLLVPGSGWDDERIYRAAFLYGDDGRLRVWYSAKSSAGQWHVGYSEAMERNLDLPGS